MSNTINLKQSQCLCSICAHCLPSLSRTLLAKDESFETRLCATVLPSSHHMLYSTKPLTRHRTWRLSHMNSRGELRCDRHRTFENCLPRPAQLLRRPILSYVHIAPPPPLAQTSFAILRHRCSGSRMKVNFLLSPTSMQLLPLHATDGRDHITLLPNIAKIDIVWTRQLEHSTIIHAIAMGPPQLLLHQSILSIQTTQSHQNTPWRPTNPKPLSFSRALTSSRTATRSKISHLSSHLLC